MRKISYLKFNCTSLGALISTTKGNNPPTESEWKDFFNYINRTTDKLSDRQMSLTREIVMKQIEYEPDKLSETVRKELCKIYAYEFYNKSALNGGGTKPYTLDKGNLAELHSIEMLSWVDGVEYTKNEKLISNRYFKGLPDILIGKPKEYTGVKDVKTSFDLPMFLNLLSEPISKSNSWQMTGYLDILKLTEGEVCHCLVNMPEAMIISEKERVTNRCIELGMSETEIESRISGLHGSMTYDEIPEELRVMRFTVTSNEIRIKEAKKQVKKARTWLKELHESFQKPLTLKET